MKKAGVSPGLIYTTRESPCKGVDYNLLTSLLICSEQSSFIPGKSCAPVLELSPVVQSVRWAPQTWPDIPTLMQQLTRMWASFVSEPASLCWFLYPTHHQSPQEGACCVAPDAFSCSCGPEGYPSPTSP
jgi:hypothetical protein